MARARTNTCAAKGLSGEHEPVTMPGCTSSDPSLPQDPQGSANGLARGLQTPRAVWFWQKYPGGCPPMA